MQSVSGGGTFVGAVRARKLCENPVGQNTSTNIMLNLLAVGATVGGSVIVSLGTKLGTADGGGSSVGDDDSSNVGVTLGEVLGCIVDGLLLGAFVDGLLLGPLVVGLDDSSTVGVTVGKVVGLIVDGLLLGPLVVGLVDGGTVGNARWLICNGGKWSSTQSIPLRNSEQNKRFTMNGRLVSTSSIFTCAASPMQQFKSASGSKTQEHAVQ